MTALIRPCLHPALRLLLVTLANLSAAVSLQAAASHFWVATDGNDEGPGTLDRPFATLDRAREAVRTTVQGGKQDDDIIVHLRGGVHRLNHTLEFTQTEVGEGRHAIIFTSQPDERAVISGSRPIAGTWRRVKDELWSLAVPEAAQGRWIFRSLFRSGRSLQRAREPDTGWFVPSSVDSERRRLTLSERLPAAWAGVTGVEINSVAHWHFNRQPAEEITETTVIGRRAIGSDVSSDRMSEKAHARIWLENALVFADAPGEWYLDSTRGELFYRAMPGEDPNEATFSAPVLRELLVVRGTADQPVRNVHFRGIEFAETDWEMPAEGRLGLQAGAWAYDRSRTYTPGAALRFVFAVRISVQDCTFRDLGDGALSFEIGSREGLVRQCDFERVGSNVIQVGRMPEFTGDGHPMHRDFRSPRERLDGQKTIPTVDDIYREISTRVAEAPGRITLADNRIVNCGTLDYGSVAILVGYAHHVKMEHNLIRDLPYTGISIGWRWAPGFTHCHSNLVLGNRIERVMQQAGDGGAIYLVGDQPGTRVMANYVHDSGRNYSSHGIYADAFSDHMEISDNYVTGVMDRSLYLSKNGPDMEVHGNNGEPGPTLATGGNDRGGRWVKFYPARTPPDLSLYGPRRPSLP
ncbi:MAG: right-handed parallel beta-helix repeat-containing protein [Opitutaceae bacterium]